MPTPTMPDEDLDALFRRGAQAYPDEVLPPAAWERMERQLDTAAATQRLRRKVGRIFAVELLVLLLLVWQGYRYGQRPAEVASWLSTAAQVDKSTLAARSPRAAAGATGPLTARGGRPSSGAPALVSPSSPAQLTSQTQLTVAARYPTPSLAPEAPATTTATTATVARRATRSQRQRLGQPVAAGPAGYRRALGASQLRARRAQKLASETFTILVDKSKSLAKSPLYSALQPTPLGLTPEEELAYALPRPLFVAPYPLPDSLTKLATAATTLPTDSAKTKKRPAPRPAYRLVLGVLGAPSFSGVRTAQSAQLGGDYGLTLDYRFAPRLRVRAGVTSSQKRYQAASTDYQAPAAWQWFAGDYTLDASCRVTEIPLDLRYDVLRRPTYSVFTSLGINSLLMRNERYSYDWTMSGQTFTKTAQVVKGSNHFLSVLNVSVGLERPLGARWSAQVEPYWQFPLGGVGAGQVHLSSAGAAFSLKYGLFR